MAGLVARIEHTDLRPTATAQDLRRLCAEAVEHGFAAVCVYGRSLPRVAAALAGSPVIPCAVVGFPHGASSTAVKALEAEHAVAAGARELDMVLALGPFLEGDVREVQADIEAVVRAAGGVPVKVILETGYLNEAGVRGACHLAADAGAAYVKTSTGFGPRGATPDDVRIMREAVGDRLKIKASGGIRTRADAEALIAAGADRLGTSAGIAIVGST